MAGRADDRVRERVSVGIGRDQGHGESLSSSVVTLCDEATGVLSSSLIVPTPCPSRMWPPFGFERFTTRTSSPSSSRSPMTATVIVRVVTPVGKLSCPDAGVKSTPEVAVTPWVS